MKASNFIVYLASLFLLFRTIYITLTKFSTPPTYSKRPPCIIFSNPPVIRDPTVFIYVFIYLSFFVTKQLVIIILTNRL